VYQKDVPKANRSHCGAHTTQHGVPIRPSGAFNAQEQVPECRRIYPPEVEQSVSFQRHCAAEHPRQSSEKQPTAIGHETDPVKVEYSDPPWTGDAHRPERRS
jgi:hypothetical protein